MSFNSKEFKRIMDNQDWPIKPKVVFYGDTKIGDSNMIIKSKFLSISLEQSEAILKILEKEE
jgi:hypothetical protein